MSTRSARSTGPRRRGAALALAGLLVAAPLAACSTEQDAGSGSNFVAGDGTITLVPPESRRPPVALTGRTLEGAPFDLSTLRGKTVVVNVWGSWCPPCRKEAPDLEAAYQRLKPSGVVFVGIDSNDPDPAQAIAFQKTFKITYPSVADTDGAALLALRGAVAPNAVPTTLVLDTQGRVAARISSATTTATLVALVQDVVAGKSSR